MDATDTGGVAIGVDVGGSGIKGAVVDLTTGDLVTPRVRITTPRPASPDSVAAVVARVVARVGSGAPGTPVGVTMPAPVTHGVVRAAANIDPSWVGTDAARLFSTRLGVPVHVVNDADAAGVAEARFGAARGVPGLVLLTTLGTGIGSALLLDGRLVPNSELGHLQIDGQDAESRASATARQDEKLSWARWAERLQAYYSVVEELLWPDLIVVGGGVSKHADKFVPLLRLRAPVVAARLLNHAGIVGAAVLAAQSRTTEEVPPRVRTASARPRLTVREPSS